MSKGIATLFGGSGFIGQYATRALVQEGFRVRVAVRRPQLAGEIRMAGRPGWVDIIQANVMNEESVQNAVDGSDVCVNLVGILLEQRKQRFESVHVEGNRNIAQACLNQKVNRLVYVSAIGADINATSQYSRTKGRAESIIQEIFPRPVILRPSVVFGPQDDFFNRFAGLASSPIADVFPFLPAIGGGHTKIQPIYVRDLAKAIALASIKDEAIGNTYELGGPNTYSFLEIYNFLSETISRKRHGLPLPFFAATILGHFFDTAFKVLQALSLDFLFKPPLTADQVAQLKSDNIVSDNTLTASDLGISSLESIESIVPEYLKRYRPYGSFFHKSAA